MEVSIRLEYRRLPFSTLTATYTWIAQSLNFTIPSSGNNTLTLTATNGTTGTTSVGISY